MPIAWYGVRVVNTPGFGKIIVGEESKGFENTVNKVEMFQIGKMA